MRSSLWIASLAFAACSSPVTFQGQSTLPVEGTPPAVAAAKPPPRVEVRDNKIEIHDKIQFDYDRATIKQASFGLMNEISHAAVDAARSNAPAALGQCVVHAVDGLVLAPPDRNEGRATFVYEFKANPAPTS